MVQPNPNLQGDPRGILLNKDMAAKLPQLLRQPNPPLSTRAAMDVSCVRLEVAKIFSTKRIILQWEEYDLLSENPTDLSEDATWS